MFVRSVWIIIESVLQYKNSQIPSAAIWKLRFKPIAVRRITYFPANIRLNEDVFRLRLQKTSSRRLDQDEYVRLSLTSSEDVFKTSWSRPIYSSWLYVFKTSSRRFQDVFKTSSRRLAKTSSRHLQDVLLRRFQEVFKTSSRLLAKMCSRRLSKMSSRPFQDVSSS